MIRRISFALLIAALGWTTSGSAQEEPATDLVRARTGVVLSKSPQQLKLWTKNGSEEFKIDESTVMPQRKLQKGNMIVLRETSEGSKLAAQIVLVDEQVWVTGKGSKGSRALIGTTWQSQSPSHLVVRTAAGEEMFVVDPKTFRQPLPEPNQRIALLYRVETARPPRYKATGFVVLGDAIAKSPVEIIYSDIPQPVEQVAEVAEPAPAPAPAPEPEEMTELPQTASGMPMVLVSGLLLIAIGTALRRFQSVRHSATE